MDKALEIELAEIRPKVLALALKFFRSSHLDGDPEDVVQDVLLRLWMARRDGARIRSVEAWDDQDASASLELSETERIAESALRRLPAGTQRLLQLRATGLSLDEIAAITGRTKGGVKSSISAARQEFMKSFNPK